MHEKTEVVDMVTGELKVQEPHRVSGFVVSESPASDAKPVEPVKEESANEIKDSA